MDHNQIEKEEVFNDMSKEVDVEKCVEETNVTEKGNAKSKKGKNTPIIIGVAIVLIVAFVVGGLQIYKNQTYKSALQLKKDENYTEAMAVFEKLGNYKDSKSQGMDCNYKYATDLMEAGEYNQALAIFSGMEDYKRSGSFIKKCVCGKARLMMDEKDYEGAKKVLEEYAGDENVDQLIKICNAKEEPFKAIIDIIYEKDAYSDETSAKFTINDDLTLKYECNEGGKECLYFVWQHNNHLSRTKFYLYGEDAGKYEETYDSYYGNQITCLYIMNGSIKLEKYKSDTKLKDLKFDKAIDLINKRPLSDFEPVIQLRLNTLLDGLQLFLNATGLELSLRDLGINSYTSDNIKEYLPE